ncbi:MAG: tetratricopeptide repeat protein [Bacteroidales bacterium]|nr:tetratricopeptide repeat protein [Bacteroidales bacterium]
MNNNEEEFTSLLKKCEQMLASKKEVYFDVDEFLELIDYYTEHDEDEATIEQLYTYAQKQHGFHSEIEASRAMFLVDCMREDDALQIFHKLIKLEPDDGYHAADLSFIYAHKGDIANAFFYLKRAIALNPEEEENTVCYIATELLLHAHYEAAQKLLQHTLNKYPNNSELLYYSAMCYTSMGNTEKGIALLQSVVQADPYNSDAWFNLGVAYWQSSQFAEAIEALDYALAINAEFVAALFVKATCLVAMKATDEAIQILKEIVEIAPNHIEALDSLADCYAELEDFEQSVNCRIALLEVDPDHAKSWARLAKMYALDEDYKQAVELYKKAIELEPDNGEIVMDFALLLNVLDLYDEAISVCKQAVKFEPNNAELWLHYANVERSNKKIDKALKVLQQALKHTDEAVIHYTIAELYIQQKKIDKAVEYFTFAYAKAPEMADVFFENCTIPTKELELFHSIIHTNL